MKCPFDISRRASRSSFCPPASSVHVALFALEACRVGRVSRTRRRSHRRCRRRRRRRRFGIPAFPYETNGMHKYFRRYSTERAEGGFSAATSACARRASVPNYRVGFMNTIAATARKLAWRHWLLLPLMNLCICIPRRCSARGTPQKKKKKKSRLLSARFLTLLRGLTPRYPRRMSRCSVRLTGTARWSPRCCRLLEKEMSEFRERR